MKTYKLFLLSIGLVFSILISLSFVMGDTVGDIITPISYGNYSTLLNITVNTTYTNATNVTCWYNSSGGTASEYLIEMLNITTGQTVFENSTIDISGLTDSRTYNISCTILNLTTASRNTSIANIRIDNSPPNVTAISTITNPLRWGNYSRTVIFNITIADMVSNISYIFFNLTNFTNGQSVIYIPSRQASTNWWNISINTSLLNDGAYNLTIWANDTAGNMNSSEVFYNLSFDNTDPGVTHSCTPLYPSSGDTVICTCSGSDYVSGVSSTSFAVNPSTTTIGTRTTTCTVVDSAGNNGTNIFTYYVSSGGGSTDSGGSTSPVWTSTRVVTDEQLIQGYTKALKSKERAKVQVNNQNHYVGVTEIDSSTVTIQVSSTIQTATLSIGDERKFDVSEDGYYDLSVKLNSIENNKAEITIKSIKEKVTEESEFEETEKEGSAETLKDGEATSSKDLIWLWVVIIVVALLIGIGYGAKKKGYF